MVVFRRWLCPPFIGRSQAISRRNQNQASGDKFFPGPFTQHIRVAGRDSFELFQRREPGRFDINVDTNRFLITWLRSCQGVAGVIAFSGEEGP